MGGAVNVKDVAGFGSLLVAIITGAIWLGSLSARTDSIESTLRQRENESDRLARVEVALSNVNDNLRDIKAELQKQNTR